jgi:hypothetical protein
LAAWGRLGVLGKGKHPLMAPPAVKRLRTSSPEASLDEPLEGASESLLLECDCKGKLILDSRLVARLLWHERFDEHDGFVCSRCEKGFIVAGVLSHRYSWMEDYLEQLEGKEAREAYYARLF